MIRRLARARIFLGWILAVLVLFLALPTATSLILGAPLAILGLGFRSAAAGIIQKDTVLARQGPYRLTRNPLYFGSFLLALGFGIMGGRLLTAALVIVPSILIYPTVIRNEEAHLRRRFGSEFEEFRRAVPCFLPRRLTPSMFETFTTSLYMTNREYNATLGFLTATALLLAKLFWSSQ